MPDTETYTINRSQIPDSALCVCGHPYAAHGSNGMICCACQCRVFQRAKG